MNEAYALATVVGREAPVSSHLGDRAVVHADGRMEGYVGGACSREIIRRQALESLASGEPRLVRIRPGAPEARVERDVVTVPMRCVSEGSVDVYVEPHLAPREMFLVGFTPVADALARLAPVLDYRVVRFVEGGELDDLGPETGAHDIDTLGEYLAALDAQVIARSVAIVASQGHYDENALHDILQHPFAFAGLLASRKRAEAIASVLLQQGLPAERIERVVSPAGLDIGARKPAEVAISILAQIVATQNAPASRPETAVADAAALDPVCGMSVEITGSLHRAEAGGKIYHFCCPGCRAAFAANPDAYLTASARS